MEPHKGCTARCSLGLLGRITSDAPQEVTYADGNKGLAWVGVQLEHKTFVSPFTGETITVEPGGPWSSRTPVVVDPAP